MKKHPRGLVIFLAAVIGLMGFAARGARGAPFPIAKIYFEYNSSANDLGVHVFLDGEDWRNVKIVHPDGRTIFDVTGKGGWGELGMTDSSSREPSQIWTTFRSTSSWSSFPRRDTPSRGSWSTAVV
jgi:hypothetical protein